MNRKLVLTSIVLFILLSCSFTASVKADSTHWSQTYGGTENDWAFSLVETSDGGYAIAGSTQSSGAGAEDFWLIKTDSQGNIQWSKTYGGPSVDIAHSLVVTSDGGYALAGYTASLGAGSLDFWFVKTDSSGDMEWNRTYGQTGSEWARMVIKTSDGGYAIVGETNSIGAGNTDSWLVKTDSSGELQWSETYGGSENDEIWSLVETDDEGYALLGYTDSFGAGNNDFWLVKTNATGKTEWSRTYGGTGWDYAYSLVEASGGGYALAGSTESFGEGQKDFWLVRTDASGTMMWNKTYGGADDDSANSLITTTFEGGYVMAGYTKSFGAGNEDFWLVKTDSSGNTVWTQTYGGTGLESAREVIATIDEAYAIVGGTKPSSSGDEDCLLVKTILGTAIPEYSSWILPLLLLTATLFVVINKKKLFNQRS